MTLHLEPVPGGFYDEIGGLCVEFDLDYLLDGDQSARDSGYGWNLRADVLVVAEERTA